MHWTMAVALAVVVAGCSENPAPAAPHDAGVADTAVEATFADCTSPLYQYRVPSGQSGVPAEWEPLGATPVTTTLFLQAFFCSEGWLGDDPLGTVFFAVLAGDSANAPPPSDVEADVWFWGYGILALTDSPAFLAYLQDGGMTAEAATAESSDGPLGRLTVEGSGWSIEGECTGSQQPDSELTAEMFLYHGPRADPILFAARTEGAADSIEAGTLRGVSGLVGGQLAPAGATPSTCSTSSYDVLARFLAVPE